MKRWHKILILAAALLVAAGGTLAVLYLAHPFHTGDLTGLGGSTTVEGRTIAPMQVDANGDFVILQFTDTHLSTAQGADRKLLALIESQTARVLPDLVVITGDMLDGYNARIVRNKQAALTAIADIFERRQQPWVWLPGNNDGEYMGSNADIAAYLSGYDYCLISNEPGLTGTVQFTLPLHYEDGSIAHELIFMDSLARDPATNYITYDAMKPDQADWLAARLSALKQAAPLARASIFFHMNTPAFTAAKNQGEPYAEGYAKPDFPDSWAIAGNRVIDDAIAAAGNVGLVSIGHLHPSANQCAYHGKTYYHIARSTRYAKEQGGTVITLHTDDGNPRRQYTFSSLR